MDDEAIELSAGKKKAQSGELAFEGSRFISVHPEQDSLDFYSVAARFDLQSFIIHARKVKFIAVADALIYPDSGNVTIERKAVMQTLENSKILANSVTKYHNLYNGTVNVLAKRNYIGSAYYDYEDENKRKQTIFFSNLAVDTTGQTSGTGTIAEEDEFTLSPNFKFKGDVRLAASRRYLIFSGTTEIGHECLTMEKRWFKFTAEIDPEDIYIPIDTVLEDENGVRLASGMLINTDSIHLYSTFLSKKKKRKDIQVLTAQGFLKYDKAAAEYQISNLNKLNERTLPGSYISMSTNDCSIYGEGKIDLGVNLGRIDIQPVGEIKHDLKEDKIDLDMVILLDFFLADNALDKMAKNLEGFEGLDGTAFDRPVYSKGLNELIESKEDAGKRLSEVQLYGNFRKFPNELNKTIYINEVKMRWNAETNSYQSYGPIGISNMGKKQINKKVSGHIEIVKKRSSVGDIMKIYLELDSKNWYFFSYSRNLMTAYSSDEDFNNVIKETKPDKRKMGQEKGKPPYTYMLGSKRKKTEFQRRFVGTE